MGVSQFLPARSTPTPTPTPVPVPVPTPDPVVTAETLMEAAGLTAAEAARLAPVVSLMVDRYSPAAPLALRQEAAIRVAGWLVDSPTSNLRKSTIGPVSSYDFAATQRGALLHSGAKALLAPYRQRTAGLAG